MATFGNLWQLLAPDGNLWQLLANYGNIWQLMATIGKIWQLLATVGNLLQLMAMFGNWWQLLTTDGNFWQLLAVYGNIWQLKVTYGNFLRLMATFGNWRQLLAIDCKLWQLLGAYGNFWELMATYGIFCQLWQHLATYGNFWQFMATFGRIRLLLATFWGYMQVREFLCGIFISTKFIFVFDTRSQQFGKCISVEYIFLGAQSIKQYFVWKKTYFSALGVQKSVKTYPQKKGPLWKLAHSKCCPHFFRALYICRDKIISFSHEKVFAVTINVTVTRVPRAFWNLAKK